MPTPVSVTVTVTCCADSRGSARTTISPHSVYLMALLMRFRSTMVRRAGSDSIVGRSGATSTRRTTSGLVINGRSVARRDPSIWARETCSSVGSSRPDSALARSRRSSTRTLRSLAQLAIRPISVGTGSSGWSSRRMSPRMEFTGVRSSWLTLFRNRVLASLAAATSTAFWSISA
jgi:hypothetical protein